MLSILASPDIHQHLRALTALMIKSRQELDVLFNQRGGKAPHPLEGVFGNDSNGLMTLVKEVVDEGLPHIPGYVPPAILPVQGMYYGPAGEFFINLLTAYLIKNPDKLFDEALEGAKEIFFKTLRNISSPTTN